MLCQFGCSTYQGYITLYGDMRLPCGRLYVPLKGYMIGAVSDNRSFTCSQAGMNLAKLRSS